MDRAFSRTFSEPEVEGDPKTGKALQGTTSWGRRDAVRSTIYSGSCREGHVAMKKNFEGRLHSPRRRSLMGSPSGGLAGSSSKSSRPPDFARQTTQRLNSSGQATVGGSLCRPSHHRRLIPATATQHRNHDTQQPPGYRHNGFLFASSLLQGLEDRPQRRVRRTTRQAASTSAQRSSLEPCLVIPNSLLRPADSRRPGTSPA